MSASLTEFLQAKYALDQRSINIDVWRHFIDQIAAIQRLQLLDAGTGTGSMLRRLLLARDHGEMSLTGLDRAAELLQTAEVEISGILRHNGFDLTRQEQTLIADSQHQHIEFLPVCRSLSEFSSAAGKYHVVSAHAFMDLVPLQQTLQWFITWLKPQGLFYSTINYDSETVIFPPYHDTDFETELLAEYDASMERRRIHGQAAGGAKCGRRLFQTLQQTGFDIIAYGSSDWNITPVNGHYQDDDPVILRYLLYWIHQEAEQSSAIDRIKLNQWHQLRLHQLNQVELGIIIHQLDILARKTSPL